MATVEEGSIGPRESRALALDELRHLWRHGAESGQSVPLDPEEIKRRGRERLARAQSV